MISTHTTHTDRPGVVAETTPGRCASRSTFDEIYSKRYEAMVRLASGMVDRRSEAEEIVQESFGQLWQRWETVSRPGTYLRTSVVNGCHNELRRRHVRREAAHKLAERDLGMDIDYLADALGRLEERRRKAVVLRYYGELSTREIAEALAVPTGTVKSLIHRGLADLRAALDDERTSGAAADDAVVPAQAA